MGSHSVPINLSPTPVPGRLAALPSKQTGTMQLFVTAGDLQQRQTIGTALPPPSFPPLFRNVSDQERNKASDPIRNVPSSATLS